MIDQWRKWTEPRGISIKLNVCTNKIPELMVMIQHFHPIIHRKCQDNDGLAFLDWHIAYYLFGNALGGGERRWVNRAEDGVEKAIRSHHKRYCQPSDRQYRCLEWHNITVKWGRGCESLCLLN